MAVVGGRLGLAAASNAVAAHHAATPTLLKLAPSGNAILVLGLVAKAVLEAWATHSIPVAVSRSGGGAVLRPNGFACGAVKAVWVLAAVEGGWGNLLVNR